jgi:hypothetical protein
MQAPSLAPGAELVALGELVAVVYRTGHEAFDREHKFKGPRPLLTYEERGGLIIVGGAYKITPRGIVG